MSTRFMISDMVNKTIRGIFLVITLILLSVSVYYSRSWHVFVQMPSLIAWGLSGAFVVSATALFDLAIGRILHVIRLKKGHEEYKRSIFSSVIVGTFFLTVWMILTAYSMYSTLAGQFNHMLLSDITVYEMSGIQQQIEILEKELLPAPVLSRTTINILIKDIDDKTQLLLNEKKNLNDMIGSTADIEKGAEYRTVIRDTNARISVIESELNKLSVEKRNLLIPLITDNSEIELELRKLKTERDKNITDKEKLALQEDIFEFLARIFDTESIIIRFIALAFPSILVDLISPITSALFFYGWSMPLKKEKTYEDGKNDAFAAIDAELEKRLRI